MLIDTIVTILADFMKFSLKIILILLWKLSITRFHNLFNLFNLHKSKQTNNFICKHTKIFICKATGRQNKDIGEND